MSLLFLWKRLNSLQRRAAGGHGCHRRGTSRSLRGQVVLRLEALEERTVPSTLTVTNNLDTGIVGDGSLRGEITAAASGDTINFDPSLAGQTITLTGGELVIDKSLDIEGPGAGLLTVSGNQTSRVFDVSNHASRVFDISAGATVTIAGVWITAGLANGSSPVLASTGGGILNFGSLTLSGDVLSNNQAVGNASSGKAGVGGGVANLARATLAISGSAFTGNQAIGADHSNGFGAGNAQGGAIFNTK